jgi:hypothetical protein
MLPFCRESKWKTCNGGNGLHSETIMYRDTYCPLCASKLDNQGLQDRYNRDIAKLVEECKTGTKVDPTKNPYYQRGLRRMSVVKWE